MKTFDESAHPRGQAANAGQFREKADAAPNGVLGDGDAPEEYTPNTTWRILADRLTDFDNAVQKVNRRLARAGVTERFSYTHERKVWRDEHDQPWVVEEVTLNRPVISSGNWQFLAQHEKTAAGAIITHQVGQGERIGGDASMRCDHCGQFRARQKVFTLRDRETGELKQIGSNCVALFLGARPEGLWAMAAEVGADLRMDEDPHYAAGPASPNAFDGDQLLLATIRQVELDGGEYMSKSRAGFHDTPTINKVLGSFNTLTAEKPTAQEREEMAAITAWVDALDPDEDGDYLNNLKAAFTRDEDGKLVIYGKHAGLAASVVSSYRRDLARKAEKEKREHTNAAKVAEFLYEPGESLKNKGLELSVISMRTGQDYGYGAPVHITLMDDAGHVVYWKSTGEYGAHVEISEGHSHYFCPQVGDRLRVVGGTVKDHRVSEFNGDHETVIWRVKVAPTPEWVEQVKSEYAAELAAQPA